MDIQKLLTYMKYSSYNFKFVSLMILLVSIIVLIILPFIIINFNHNHIPDEIRNSKLAQSLHDNITLRIVYYSSIFTTLPIIIDMVLDFLTLKIIKKISLFDQLYLLLLLIIPNIIFLLVENLEIFPILYWILISIQYNMMIYIVVTYFVTYSPFKCMPLNVYYIGMICIFLSNIFSTCTLLITTSSKIQYIMSILTTLFFSIASLILIITIIRWCKYYIYDTIIDSDYKYYDEWFISSIYLFALFLLLIVSIIASSISSFQYPKDMNQYSCMVYNINVALFVAILSIVPGKYEINMFNRAYNIISFYHYHYYLIEFMINFISIRTIIIIIVIFINDITKYIIIAIESPLS